MREIEIKARVGDAQQLLATLQKLDIQLSEPVKQHDVVYGQTDSTGAAFPSGQSWLRIRTENDAKVVFTLKRSVTGELDSIEHEVTVDSANELEAIILNLDYSLYSDLTKIRRKAKIDGLELCYDEVPGLGTFIELEKLSPEDADLGAVLDELWEIANKFGISKTDEETSGYDVLLRKKEGKSVYETGRLAETGR